MVLIYDSTRFCASQNKDGTCLSPGLKCNIQIHCSKPRLGCSKTHNEEVKNPWAKFSSSGCCQWPNSIRNDFELFQSW